MTAKASVIIPAHDEEGVIGRTLAFLTRGLDDGVAEILVVCNGCRDGTAAEARAFAPKVRVLEIGVASKVAALNHGDAEASAPARIYLDADVFVSGASLRRIVEALSAPGALAVEPLPTMDTAKSHWTVQRWYAVWQGLHGGIPGKIGSGVLALSPAGRARFDRFPDLIADDLFVRSHFSADELRAVDGAESIVVAPRTLRDLVRIKSRSRLGSHQLSTSHPALSERGRRARASSRSPWALPVALWPFVPLYFLVTSYIRFRATRQSRSLGSYRWERDDSSRSDAPPSGPRVR